MEFITTYEELLQHIDEYSLYCHYLGFAPELDMSYRSPIREGDLHPSFSVFVSKYNKYRGFMWKDKGGAGQFGDVFDLVKVLFGYTTTWQVLARIKGDFGMGPAIVGERRQIVYSAPELPPKVDIRVKSRDWARFDKAIWSAWGVTQRSTYDLFKIKPIRYYFKYIDQEHPYTVADRNPGYSYLVMGRYKLYFPYEKRENKFRCDMTEMELEGFEQLSYRSPLLIITKSLKEVAMLYELGYESVAPRGEHGIIPREFLDHFETRYSHIITLFDNDGKHRTDYPYPEKHVPLSSGEKDPTDFHKRYGRPATAALLKELTHGYYSTNEGRDRTGIEQTVPW